MVPGRPASPDLVLSGPPDGIIGLLAGMRDRPSVAKVTVKGDARKLARLRPHPVTARVTLRRRKRGGQASQDLSARR